LKKKKTTILITGGSGFIGRNLIEIFGNKYRLLYPTHRELDLTNDKHVTDFFKKNDIDVIIHSAFGEATSVFDHTIKMFVNIYRHIDKVQKFIYFGSGAEYDKSRDLIKVKETDFGKKIPGDDYGLAKYICYQIAKDNPKILNLRLFGIYGKYEDYLFKFISNSIVKNLSNLPIKIKQNVIFSYLFIADLIEIVKYFINNKSKYTDYNVVPTKSIDLLKIAQLINQVSRKEVEIQIMNNNLNYEYTADNKRLLSEIRNLEFTSYKDGIKSLYNFYLDNKTSLNYRKILADEYLKKAKINIWQK